MQEQMAMRVEMRKPKKDPKKKTKEKKRKKKKNTVSEIKNNLDRLISRRDMRGKECLS